MRQTPAFLLPRTPTLAAQLCLQRLAEESPSKRVCAWTRAAAGKVQRSNPTAMVLGVWCWKVVVMSPTNAGKCLPKSGLGELPAPSSTGDTAWRAVTGKRALTGHQICRHLDLGCPRLPNCARCLSGSKSPACSVLGAAHRD